VIEQEWQRQSQGRGDGGGGGDVSSSSSSSERGLAGEAWRVVDSHMGKMEGCLGDGCSDANGVAIARLTGSVLIVLDVILAGRDMCGLLL